MTLATLDDLVAQYGWVPEGEPQREGAATRLRVQLPSGVQALAYVYDDEDPARRAARAHQVAGQQMFAVPELLESGPGWLTVEAPRGAPIEPDVLESTSAGRARAVLSSLGQVLRKLHALPAQPFCGDLVHDEDGGEAARWLTFSGYVAHQLEWFSEHLRGHSFTEEQMEALAASVGDLRHELSAFHPRNPACLCHGRLNLQNVWLDEARREVVGVTGFDFAAQLPREADLAYLLWIAGVGTDEHHARALYEGYGAARTMDVQRRERFFRRLVAFQVLFGARGAVQVSEAQLIELTSARA